MKSSKLLLGGASLLSFMGIVFSIYMYSIYWMASFSVEDKSEIESNAWFWIAAFFICVVIFLMSVFKFFLSFKKPKPACAE